MTTPTGTHGRGRPLASAAVLGCALAALATVALPGETLTRLTMVVDPDRTVRPFLPLGAGAIRLGLAGLTGFLVAIAVGLRRLGTGAHGYETPRGSGENALGPERWELIALAALMFVGAALRLYHLLLPLESDEATTYVMFASRSLIDVVSDYTVPNNHVLHTVWVWASTQIFGPETLAIRGPAFLAGLAAIPFSFLAARSLRLPRAALALAATVAVAAPFVEFSGRARGYTLQFLFFLWFLHAAARLVDRERGTGWIAFVVSAALGLFTIPSFVLPLGGIVVWMALERREARFFVRLALGIASAGALTIGLYAPAIWRSGLERLISPTAWEPRPWNLLLPALWSEMTTTGACWGGGFGWLGIAAILCCGVCLAWGLCRGDPWARLSVVCLGWLLAFTFVRRLPPIARTVHWLLPIFVLGAASAFSSLGQALRISRQWAAAGLVVFATLLGLGQLAGHARARADFLPGAEAENYCIRGYFSDARPVVEAYVEARRDGDLLVAPLYSGVMSPMRVHLMRSGESPATGHSLSPAQGPSSLAGYPRWFVVAPIARVDRSTPFPALDELAPGASDLERVAAVLGVEHQELEAVADRVTAWRDIGNSRVFILDVRAELAAQTEPFPPSEILTFAW